MWRVGLAGEVLLAYIEVRWRLWRTDLPSTVRALRDEDGGSGWLEPCGASRRLGGRLANATVRTLAILPTDSRCLMRSLVLVRLLSRRRIGATLLVGAMPADGSLLRAHAWVEHGDRPLLPPGAFEPLVEL